MKISVDNYTADVEYGEAANVLNSKIYTLDGMEVISDDGTVSQSPLNNYALSAGSEGSHSGATESFNIIDIASIDSLENAVNSEAIISPAPLNTNEADESGARQANIEDAKFSGNTDKSIAFAEHGFNLADNPGKSIRAPESVLNTTLNNGESIESKTESETTNETNTVEELDFELGLNVNLSSLTSTEIPIDSIGDVSLDVVVTISCDSYPLVRQFSCQPS